MRALRAGLFATCLAAAGVALLALVDCAEPTQIVVEVYSDACPGTKGQAINQTGIAVGKSESIDNKPPSALRDGCERAPGVGTLTIYPSGDNDEEVAIKVVAGVDTLPDNCFAPGYAGCIAHRRVMRFVPHTTQRAIVRLSLACLNRTCPAGKTCDNGLCKDQNDLLPDGGTRADAETQEAGSSVDGGVADATVPPDPCVGCKGDCTNGVCNVNCGAVACSGSVCAPTLPCNITCPATGKCNDIACNTSAKCTVRCGNQPTSCGQVACNANECDVRCDGNDSCKTDGGGIRLDAGTTASLTCDGNNACSSASCNAATCRLSCDPLNGANSACPGAPNRPCTATSNCTDWNSPLQP
jgi:hypothetical protein